MIDWKIIAIVFGVLSACSTAVVPPKFGDPPFQSCQKLPAPLPRIRPPEALNERIDRIEALYRDCDTRLRMTSGAWPKEAK